MAAIALGSTILSIVVAPLMAIEVLPTGLAGLRGAILSATGRQVLAGTKRKPETGNEVV